MSCSRPATTPAFNAWLANLSKTNRVWVLALLQLNTEFNKNILSNKSAARAIENSKVLLQSETIHAPQSVMLHFKELFDFVANLKNKFKTTLSLNANDVSCINHFLQAYTFAKRQDAKALACVQARQWYESESALQPFKLRFDGPISETIDEIQKQALVIECLPLSTFFKKYREERLQDIEDKKKSQTPRSYHK
jgi:hypothetical protein